MAVFRSRNDGATWTLEPELGSAYAEHYDNDRTHLGLKDRTHLRERYLDPALADGLIEPTLPDKPNSRLQQYRLTAKGTVLLVSLRRGKPTT